VLLLKQKYHISSNSLLFSVGIAIAEPPTLKGGDPKASGLVVLKTDIIEFKKLGGGGLLPQKNCTAP
jgi:hypothetical protein